MGAVLFRCPNTGLQVQGWADDKSADTTADYVSIQCTACRRIHLVNPRTGRTLGVDSDRKP